MRLMKFNVDDGIVNEVYFRLRILKTHNQSSQTHIKHVEKCISLMEK